MKLEKAFAVATIQKMSDDGSMIEQNPFEKSPELPSEDDFINAGIVGAREVFRGVTTRDDREQFRGLVKQMVIDVAGIAGSELPDSFEITDDMVDAVTIALMEDGEYE